VHASSSSTLKQGDVLDGRYVLGDCIGQGGMGSVFLAAQLALARTVAIKVLHPEIARRPAHARRIRDEAIVAGQVRSAHCLNVIDCNTLPDGGSYLVMEYVPGRSLARLITEESLPLTRVIELFGQILAALGSIHGAGIVHADVKCDNFLVESVDGRDHVTMIDFGLARFAVSSQSPDFENGVEVVTGTPEYMAPEVIDGGPAIAASDLYGAGVILYELLTGVTPFGDGTSEEIMARHTNEAAIPPSLRCPDRNLTPALDRVVLRALEKRPEARFADAAAFASALRSAVAAAPASPGIARPDIGPRDTPSRTSRRFAADTREAYEADRTGRGRRNARRRPNASTRASRAPRARR
jgi:serine/threonine protein kinase